jgi:hypothetical protein
MEGDRHQKEGTIIDIHNQKRSAIYKAEGSNS